MNPTDALPATWRWTRMKFLKSRPFQYGANEAADIEDPDLPRFVRITDVRSDGTLRDDIFKSLPEEIAAPYTLEEGDILLARSGATVGKAFMYRNDWGRCCFAGYLIRLRPDLKRIIPTFLSYFTQTKNYSDEIAASTIQATIQNVSAERYGEFQVPTPPLPEQRVIAAFLDRKTAQIDAVVAKKQRLIERLQEKRQALISHAVTKGLDPHAPMKESGIEWLGEIPAHWAIKRLKHISPRVGVGLVINPSTYVKDEGVPFLFGGDIQPGNILVEKARRMSDEDSRKLPQSRLRPGDLVTVRVGYPGVTAVVPPELDGANCASVMVVRGAATFVSQWLCYAMNSTLGSDQINVVKYGAAQEQFNISHAVEFVFPVPPKEEQKAIANRLDSELKRLAGIEKRLTSQIAKLQEYRQTLISAAVTGKIDVTKEAG